MRPFTSEKIRVTCFVENIISLDAKSHVSFSRCWSRLGLITSRCFGNEPALLNVMRQKRHLVCGKFFLPCKKSRFIFFDKTGYVSCQNDSMKWQVHNRHKNCEHVQRAIFLILLCCKVISKDLFKILTTKIGRSGDQTFCDAAATDMPRNARNNENGKFGESSHRFGENYLKEIFKGAP